MDRLLADECVPPRLIEHLRQREFDIRTVYEVGIGNQGKPDRDVVATATSMDRVVLTVNRKHYVRLHRGGRTHAGIITYPGGQDYETLALAIANAIRDHEPLAGKLLRVRRPPAGTIVEESPHSRRT